MFKTTETNFIQHLLIILIIFFLVPSYSLTQTKNIPLESNRENFKRSVLVISHEKIFSDTNLGKAIFKKFKDNEKLLLIDAERIEKLFIEEEKELTLSRPNLDTNEFLNLANDFDKRVELERVNQRNKEAVINENLKKWKARKDRMKAEELKNPFTTVAVRHETRARLKTLAKKRFQSVTGLIEQMLEKAEKDEGSNKK